MKSAADRLTEEWYGSPRPPKVTGFDRRQAALSDLIDLLRDCLPVEDD